MALLVIPSTHTNSSPVTGALGTSSTHATALVESKTTSVSIPTLELWSLKDGKKASSATVSFGPVSQITPFKVVLPNGVHDFLVASCDDAKDDSVKLQKNYLKSQKINRLEHAIKFLNGIYQISCLCERKIAGKTQSTPSLKPFFTRPDYFGDNLKSPLNMMTATVPPSRYIQQIEVEAQMNSSDDWEAILPFIGLESGESLQCIAYTNTAILIAIISVTGSTEPAKINVPIHPLTTAYRRWTHWNLQKNETIYIYVQKSVNRNRVELQDPSGKTKGFAPPHPNEKCLIRDSQYLLKINRKQ